MEYEKRGVAEGRGTIVNITIEVSQGRGSRGWEAIEGVVCMCMCMCRYIRICTCLYVHVDLCVLVSSSACMAILTSGPTTLCMFVRFVTVGWQRQALLEASSRSLRGREAGRRIGGASEHHYLQYVPLLKMYLHLYIESDSFVAY